MIITVKKERQQKTRVIFNRSIISTTFPEFGKRIVKPGAELDWPRESGHQNQRPVPQLVCAGRTRREALKG